LPGRQQGRDSRRIGLPLPGYALLDEAAAQIGVDEATLGPFDGLAQTVVRDLLLPCKARKPSCLEDLHGPA
jgi:hypothetical protein